MRLKICPLEAKELVKKGESISGVDNSKTLSEVRTKKGTGQVSLTGSKSIKRLEKEFDEIFGLFVQICYTEKDGKRYYTSSDDQSHLDRTDLMQTNHDTWHGTESQVNQTANHSSSPKSDASYQKSRGISLRSLLLNTVPD